MLDTRKCLVLSRLKSRDVILALTVYLLLNNNADGRILQYLPLLAAAKTNAFANLHKHIEQVELTEFAKKLAECCADVGSLRSALDIIAAHICNQVTKTISKQSYLGRLCTNVAQFYASFNIEESLAVCEAVQYELKAFVGEILHHLDEDGDDPLFRALKAARQNVKPVTNHSTWYSRIGSQQAPEKAGNGFTSDSMLDLNVMVDSLLNTHYYQKDTFETLAKLSTGFIRHGYWKPVLLAINEAFSQERLTIKLISKEESETSELSEKSIKRNRGLLGWLLQVCDLYAISHEELPESLRVSQGRLRESFAKLSQTDLEHAEVYLLNLQSELTYGNLSLDILKMLSAGPSHWPAIMLEMKTPAGSCLAIALHSITAQIYSAFGLKNLSIPHLNMAYSLGCEHVNNLDTTEDDRTACAFILTNLSLYIAFHEDDVFKAWKIMSELTNQLEYVDIAQRLIYCSALIHIHETEKSRILLDSLDWHRMPQRHQECWFQLEIMLLRYERRPLEAWRLCYERIQYHKERHAKYLVIWYTVLGIRCLVETNQMRHCIYAKALIDATKIEAMTEHKMAQVFELALLAARIELLMGTKDASIQHCNEVQYLKTSISIPRLQCEWQVLINSREDEYHLDVFAQCLYTEFDASLIDLDKHIFGIQDCRSGLLDFVTQYFVQPTPPLNLEKLKDAYLTDTKHQPFIAPPSHTLNISPITPVPLADNNNNSNNNYVSEESGRQKRQWLDNGSPQRRVSLSKRRTVSFGRL